MANHPSFAHPPSGKKRCTQQRRSGALVEPKPYPYRLVHGYLHRFLGFLWVILLAAAQGCGSAGGVSGTDLTARLGKQQLDLAPEVRLFHFSPDSTRIFISLDTDDLLYSKMHSDDFSASVRITITPEAIGETPSVGQGKIISMSDHDSARKGKRIMGETVMALPAGSEYKMKFEFVDANSGKGSVLYRHTNKTAPIYRDYFLVKDGGVPRFDDRIQTASNYTLLAAGTVGSKLYVNYYADEFPWPPPPFSHYDPEPFNYEADHTFELGLDTANSTEFRAVRTGFYHFRSDTLSKEGLTLFTASADFPKVSQTEDLLGPIRYILSGKEYAALVADDNRKAALERHWLEWSGTKDRARRNITTFYGRAEEANRLFSSHVAGWKSDRGLIYIVYGKPNKVYRYDDLETWIYGEENNPMSITFHFVRVINPFTDNDFRLERNERYKASWYRAIDAWRSGRAL